MIIISWYLGLTTPNNPQPPSQPLTSPRLRARRRAWFTANCELRAECGCVECGCAECGTARLRELVLNNLNSLYNINNLNDDNNYCYTIIVQLLYHHYLSIRGINGLLGDYQGGIKIDINLMQVQHVFVQLLFYDYFLQLSLTIFTKPIMTTRSTTTTPNNVLLLGARASDPAMRLPFLVHGARRGAWFTANCKLRF